MKMHRHQFDQPQPADLPNGVRADVFAVALMSARSDRRLDRAQPVLEVAADREPLVECWFTVLVPLHRRRQTLASGTCGLG
ncbi:MAG: hypothetical protein ACRDNS_32405, partial [Trebonia sp.]